MLIVKKKVLLSVLGLGGVAAVLYIVAAIEVAKEQIAQERLENDRMECGEAEACDGDGDED